MKKKIFTLSVASIGFLLASSLLAGSVHAQTISTFAGNGTSASSGDGGAATAASFFYPSSVTRDGAGNVYVIEGDYIRKIDASGTISTIAGNGTYGYSGDGGPATAASFRIGDNYSDIVADNSGNIYFTDVSNHRIRKISASGIITTIAGTGSGTHGGDDGPATAADLYAPFGLAMDAAGNMYIADASNSVIRKINMATGIITTVAGTPSTPGYSGDGGAATAAQLRSPRSVTVDAAGNMYIAEYSNHAIRKVAAATGIISTLAGDGTSGSTGDGGAATAARLNRPKSVLADPAGNIFIGDVSNDAIRKISTSGIITTVAGTLGTSGYSGDGGAATAATFDSPADIFLTNDGNMYIADASNYRIRLVTAAAIALSGTTSSCVAGTNTLSAATTGGAWTSGNPAVATVSSTGVVTGVSGGTATISYGMGLGFGSTVYTVNPAPVPVISAAGPSLSVAGSYSSYQWLLGGTPIPGATSATHTATANGSYALTVTDANGCTGTSSAQVVSGVGISGVSVAGPITIFPNPAKDAVAIANIAAGSRVAILDITGKTVYQNTASATTLNITTSHLSAGLYVVKITDNNEQTSIKKLVVNR